jgi:hypothetical protein
MPNEPDRETLLGNLAIELKLITPDQLKAALTDQAQDKVRLGFVRQVGTILVVKGWINDHQLMDLLREQSLRRARRLRDSAGAGG